MNVRGCVIATPNVRSPNCNLRLNRDVPSTSRRLLQMKSYLGQLLFATPSQKGRQAHTCALGALAGVGPMAGVALPLGSPVLGNRSICTVVATVAPNGG